MLGVLETPFVEGSPGTVCCFHRAIMIVTTSTTNSLIDQVVFEEKGLATQLDEQQIHNICQTVRLPAEGRYGLYFPLKHVYRAASSDTLRWSLEHLKRVVLAITVSILCFSTFVSESLGGDDPSSLT